MEKITAAKQHYMAADKRCKDAEETIKRETEETGIFKKQLDDKFNEVLDYSLSFYFSLFPLPTTCISLYTYV